MKKLLPLLASLVAGAMTAGAAQPPEVQPADAPARTEAAGADADYIIGPGDTIQVFVWQEPELSVTVPIRNDGKVTTPLVEDITAVGLTPSGLARAMEQRLSKYIKSPQVNIIVVGAQSEFSKITVIGQVRSPQAVPYRNGMTLLDVALAVGGLGDFAAGNRAEIVRKDADGKEQRIRVKLADLLTKGRDKENIEMRPGDRLIVPQSRL